MSSSGGERLDHYLVRTGHAASRRDAREMVARGAVIVNGRRGVKGAVVQPGDDIEVESPSHLEPIEPEPNVAIEVLFEDAAIIVVNKPGGIPCHPLRPGERGTIMNAVAARFPETALVGNKPIEGGLIHRLDNGTSGALMITRSSEAFSMMRAAIRSGLIKRKYLALVSGNVKVALTLDAPIAHHRKNSRKMIIAPDGVGRRAVTRIEPIQSIGNFTLLAAMPSTGVRHQIRVHLANAGHPIIGDELYGGPTSNDLKATRFWLHLSEMEFESPASGTCKVSAPLPPELSQMI